MFVVIVGHPTLLGAGSDSGQLLLMLAAQAVSEGDAALQNLFNLFATPLAYRLAVRSIYVPLSDSLAPGGGRRAIPGSLTPGKGICFAFQKGECSRGDGCRFVHEGGRQPRRWPR